MAREKNIFKMEEGATELNADSELIRYEFKIDF